MTGKPLYKVPAGSQLVLDGRQWLVTGRDEDGYSVEGVEDGECLTLLYFRVDQAIRDRDCDVIKPADAERRAALLQYTGGFELMEQLPDDAQTFVRGRLALVLAMDELESEGCKLTQVNTSQGGCFRSKMVTRAKEFAPDIKFLEKKNRRGGKMTTGFECPQGRTLAKYQSLYHQYGRNPVVLMDRDHLKGRRESRLSQLQEQFIDYVIALWHDTRKPKLAPLVAGAMT